MNNTAQAPTALPAIAPTASAAPAAPAPTATAAPATASASGIPISQIPQGIHVDLDRSTGEVILTARLPAPAASKAKRRFENRGRPDTIETTLMSTHEGRRKFAESDNLLGERQPLVDLRVKIVKEVED